MANADLAAGGAVGAAFGVGFGNLHDAVKHVVVRIIMFKSELNRLKSTLDGVAATVQQIKELNQALNFPEEETKSLIEQMEKGKELVDKCSKIKLWNYCFKAYSYSSKLSKLNEDIKKFCQVNLIVQNTRNGLETLSLVSQNTEIGLETLTGVNQNTRVGLETLAEMDHNTTIGLETLAEVKRNTTIGLEALTELNQNTTIGLETLAEVNHNTTIGLEALTELNQNTTIGLETLAEVNHNTRIGFATLAEMNELKRTLDLVLTHVESQNSDMKKKYGFSCAVPKLRDYIVGFDLHLKELKRELLKEEVSVLIVTALGGCGKTTLVTMLGWDKEIIGKYMSNIFFVNISKTPNLKVIVQNLFSYIGNEYPEFQSDEDAFNQLEQLLNKIGQPILLILDDVWPESESLIAKFKFNIPNYKIVVTSRKAFSRFKFTFKLNPLDHEDAMRLFCHSASMQDGSSYRLEEDMEKIVRYCGGLPIALEVIGGSLCGQPVEVWKSEVMGWSEGHSIFDSDNEVLARLQKSLEFSANKIILKEYFMDLGSFPEDQRIPATALIDIWTELHESSKNDDHAIAKLHELNSRNLACLVMKRKDAEEVSYYYNEEFVTQHGLLRELAIQLSSQKPIIERTRLIVDIRENNLPDWWMKPQHINARLLSISTDKLFSSSWCNIQAPEVEALILNLRTRNYTLPEFVKTMDKLKVIIVTNYGFFPAELSNFQLLSSLHHLKRIRLEKVSISSLCNTLVQLRSLEKISLFMCNIGQTFGNFTIQVSDSFPNLKEINIDYCNDLVELPAWLCEFLHLKELNITDCHKLSKLPEEIGKSVNLEVLRLRSCTELSELPESIRSLHKLRILDISDCISIIKLPQHIGELHKLKELHMKECLRLRKQLPSSITKLKELRLVVCDEEGAKLWEPFEEEFSNLKVMVAKKDINLNDIKVYMANLEHYKKVSKDDRVGYYDRYKNKLDTSDINLEVYTGRLTCYWEEVVDQVEKRPQTVGAYLRTRSLFGGTNYRRMIEPLDIADYYKAGKQDYINQGRSKRYIILEQLLKETEKPSSGPNELKKQNVASSLTEDSCFWAHVEEARISCKLLRSGESNDMEKETNKLIEFENYVYSLMKNYAVSSEIFLPRSSFMTWWREYREIKGTFYRSHLTGLMNNEENYDKYAKGCLVIP